MIPFVFALVVSGSDLRAYWAVDRKPKRSARIQRLENIRANPSVEFHVDGYDEDWGRLWWVRAAGTAREVSSSGERDRAWLALRAKYPQYAEEPSDGSIVAIEIERVQGWEGTG